MASQLDMAEQQIYGYYCSKQGDSLETLVKGMGLSFREYCEMIDKGMIDYLPGSYMDEIYDATN